MFSDRINWIDLIFFSRLPPARHSPKAQPMADGDEAEKTQFRFSGKKAEEQITGAFPLALLFCRYND